MEWYPYETAPKDGTSVLLKVKTNSLVILTGWYVDTEQRTKGQKDKWEKWMIACMGEILPYEVIEWAPLPVST